jgi:7,8-dihydropterin-6-yl-methyl-4-(beta-D-ribofuranosyl)aminobenzene 5'-phosphate synthase
MNPVEIAALDALDLLVVVDNDSDTLSSVDKAVPQLPDLRRQVAGFPILRPRTAMTASSPGGYLCLACPY